MAFEPPWNCFVCPTPGKVATYEWRPYNEIEAAFPFDSVI